LANEKLGKRTQDWRTKNKGGDEPPVKGYNQNEEGLTVLL